MKKAKKDLYRQIFDTLSLKLRNIFYLAVSQVSCKESFSQFSLIIHSIFAHDLPHFSNSYYNDVSIYKSLESLKIVFLQ